jgi:hypothetical protein
MAELAGYHPNPSQQKEYNISYDGKLLRYDTGLPPGSLIEINAENAQEAVEQFISGGDAREYAEREEIPYELFVRGLSASIVNRRLAADRKLMNAPKTVQTLTDWFNNNETKYRFIFYISPDYHKRIEKTPGVITCVIPLTYENVDGIHPLTPFMILHNLGHAVNDQEGMGIDGGLYKSIRGILFGASQSQADSEEDDELYAQARRGSPSSRIREEYNKVILTMSKLLHTRAALKTCIVNPNASTLDEVKTRLSGGYDDWDEIVNDLIAVYAKNGRVKVTPNKYCDFNVSEEQLLAIRNIIASTISGMLDQAVGQVIYVS